MIRKISVVLVALMIAGLAAKNAPAQDKKLATIKGKIKYSGNSPDMNKKDTTDKDPESCDKERPLDKLNVDAASKGLADVVVFVKEKLPGEFDAKFKKVDLDQKKCVFKSHVTLVAEGGTVTFKNSDGVLHNVKFSSTNNGSYNQGVGAGKDSEPLTLAKADFIELSCSVHPWMSGVIVVMAHPYYTVSNATGDFELQLPAGKHHLMVQHQTLGKLDKKGLEIEVKDGETKTLPDFEFK
jgi:plastocyanin